MDISRGQNTPYFPLLSKPDSGPVKLPGPLRNGSLDSNWTRTQKTSEVGHKTYEDLRSRYENFYGFPKSIQSLPNISKVDPNSSEDFRNGLESFRRFPKSARRLPKLTRRIQNVSLVQLESLKNFPLWLDEFQRFLIKVKNRGAIKAVLRKFVQYTINKNRTTPSHNS